MRTPQLMHAYGQLTAQAYTNKTPSHKKTQTSKWSPRMSSKTRCAK